MEVSFTAIDYLVLLLTLLLSLIIGLYYAFFKKQNTAKEYLHGGKDMNFIAVSLSIISSTLSGVSLISFPTEIYYYGSQYLVSCIVITFVALITYYWILPVFYTLQLTSIFAYFELRFDSKVKLFSSILFTIQMILYLPIVIYVPGLAIAQVTNISVHMITPVICLVCIVYTVFGGIKAVIWTDALQFFVMLGSTAILLVLGIMRVGGVETIYNIAYDTGRLSFDFDVNPTKRDTFWTSWIGSFPHLISFLGFGQGSIQKYLSLRNYKDIERTQVVSTIGLTLIYFLMGVSGLVVLAQYVYCDPVLSKKVKKPDQLLPYYIMDVGRGYPGLCGLFVAGVISAGLSTLSAALNSLAATMYNDFLKASLPEKTVKYHEAPFLKFLVALTGTVCVSLVYVIEHLGNILPLFISFIGLTNGPMIGLFIIGMFIPSTNAKGALWAGIISLLFLSWLIFTSQWYRINGVIKQFTLPVYTNKCQFENVTTNYSQNPKITFSGDVSSVYKISHHYYPAIGIIVVVIISYIISRCTKEDTHEVRDDCLSPLVHYFRRRARRVSSYKSVEEALNTTSTI